MSSQQQTYHRFVLDLGVAAYLLMHGYNVMGKKGKAIYFECYSEEEVISFNEQILEYQPPNEFYTFDSCLMYLKKIGEGLVEEINSEDYVAQTVADLGAAAYIMLQEYDKKLGTKVLGKKDRLVYFKVPVEKVKDFQRLSFVYLKSPFQAYDNCLMTLKKTGECLP